MLCFNLQAQTVRCKIIKIKTVPNLSVFTFSSKIYIRYDNLIMRVTLPLAVLYIYLLSFDNYSKPNDNSNISPSYFYFIFKLNFILPARIKDSQYPEIRNCLFSPQLCCQLPWSINACPRSWNSVRS